MRNNRVVAIAAILMLWVAPTYAALYEAPPEIIPTLPRFCWPQYMAHLPEGFDEYISGCGEYANHYCPGVVQMKMADTERDTGKKMFLLSQAEGNMEYTLNFTKDIPDCFLRPHAQANLQMIKFKIDMLKLQMKTRTR